MRLYINIYQEDTIKDREAFENVGESRLEMKIVLGEYRDTEDVACKYSGMRYGTFLTFPSISRLFGFQNE